MRADRAWLAVLVAFFALLAAIPVLAVVTRGIGLGSGATGSHLASSVLPGYVGNTLALLVLVGVGTAVGVPAPGWLVARYRCLGSPLFEWALLLPLAMPSYVMAFAYTDFLQYAGPLQTTLREVFGWSRDDYWFPDVRSLPGAAAMFTFALYPYLYLLAPTALAQRRPARAGRRARALAGRTAARTPGDCCRCRARAHGDTRRLWHRCVFRRRHVHDRHLPRVVHARRPARCCATGRGSARVRRRRRRAGALVAARPWRTHRAARPADRAVRA